MNFHSLAAGQFTLSTNVSAESVSHSTPAVRVTWSTTIPPECVTSVRVVFRTISLGPVVATYTTTNTSQTEVIQTGLQCTTKYYIRVVVTGVTSDGITPTVSSSAVQVFVGGTCDHCVHWINFFFFFVVFFFLRLTTPLVERKC